MNALFVAGLAIVVAASLAGVWLLGRAGRALRLRARNRKLPAFREGAGAYAGALSAAEVYVPGSIGRRLGGALAMFALAALAGLPLLWMGSTLERLFTRVDEPKRILRVSAAPGRVAFQAGPEEARSGALEGRVVVAHGELLRFHGALGRLGLGVHARVTHLAGYQDSGAVLARRATGRLDVGAGSRLFGVCAWLGERAPTLVSAARRFSPPLAVPAERSVLASPDGLDWE